MQDDEQQESTAHPPSISSGERGSAAAPPPTEAAAAEAAVVGDPGAKTEGSVEGSAEGSKTKETALELISKPSGECPSSGTKASRTLEMVRACNCLRVHE